MSPAGESGATRSKMHIGDQDASPDANVFGRDGILPAAQIIKADDCRLLEKDRVPALCPWQIPDIRHTVKREFTTKGNYSGVQCSVFGVQERLYIQPEPRTLNT